MTIPVKNKIPEIGDIYIASGNISAFMVDQVPSYVSPTKIIRLPTPIEIPVNTCVVLLDVCLYVDIFHRGFKHNSILYKVFSLELKQNVYVELISLWEAQKKPDASDYRRAIHAWFLSFHQAT